jgi:hypothetical protein
MFDRTRRYFTLMDPALRRRLQELALVSIGFFVGFAAGLAW